MYTDLNHITYRGSTKIDIMRTRMDNSTNVLAYTLEQVIKFIDGPAQELNYSVSSEGEPESVGVGETTQYPLRPTRPAKAILEANERLKRKDKIDEPNTSPH